MADEEAPGNGGGVHDVNAQQFQRNICVREMEEEQHQRALDVADGPQAGEGDGGSGRVNSVGPKDLQNIRLVIDIGDDRTVEIPLKGKLILQNSGPPQAAAAAGDSADAEDKEFLDKMRGWLMTVGTLFVTMAFQAALQPPAWLRTTDFLQLSQSEIDKWGHRHHGASHAAAAAVGPARFAPSPSPSRQAAESATGLSWRAKAYMYCNYITFGGALSLVLLLLWKIPPHRAKHTMGAAAWMMMGIALSAVATVVLGTSEDWHFTVSVTSAVVLYTGLVVAALYIIPDIIALIWKRLAGDRAERTAAP